MKLSSNENFFGHSRAYSPSIGPAIRRCIARFDVDVILDGEMISWDDGNKECIAFGYNRAVAKERKEWMEQNGCLDERDKDPHAGREDELNILTVSESRKSKSNKDSNEDYQSGSSCWLKFVAFDILYIDGPDAFKLLEPLSCINNTSLMQNQCENLGSIINLPLYQRKSILYQ